MKQTNICPKCQAANVARIKAYPNTSTSNTVQLTKWGTQLAFFDHYLCTSCGYMEQYADLVDKKWQKWLTKQREENSLDSDFV